MEQNEILDVEAAFEIVDALRSDIAAELDACGSNITWRRILEKRIQALDILWELAAGHIS